MYDINTDKTMISKLELLEAFFAAWEELRALPKGQGPERQASIDLVHARAEAVRKFQSGPAPDPGVNDFRKMQAEVLATPPVDTRGANFKGQVNVAHG